MNKLLIISRVTVLGISMVGVTIANNNSINYPSSSNWTGFYAGMDAGFIINNVQLNSQHLSFTNPSETCNTGSTLSTFFPALHLGYLHQFSNNFVSGIETSVAFNTNKNTTLGCTSSINPQVYDRFSFRNQMETSIKARGGRAINWNKNIFLPYIITGASFAHTGLTYQNEGNDFYSKNTTPTGWLIGAGIELAFKKNWSLRAEYTYIDYGNSVNLKLPSIYDLIDSKGKAQARLNANSLSIGINYWI